MKKENKYIFAAVICALLATISSTRPARALSAGLLADLSTQTVTKKDSVVDLNDLIGENAVLPERVFSDSVAGGKPVEGISADSIITDTLNKVKKSRFVLDMVDLDNVVNFTAKDSLVIAGNNNAFMYGPSNVTYGDIDLKANEIHMNMTKMKCTRWACPTALESCKATRCLRTKAANTLRRACATISRARKV